MFIPIQIQNLKLIASCPSHAINIGTRYISLLDNLADQVLAVNRVALLDTKRADFARVRSGDDHFLLSGLLAWAAKSDV